jgi:hypothetical protein
MGLVVLDGSLWYDLTSCKMSPDDDRPQEPKPAPYVNDIKDTTAYFANRILKDFKEKCGSCTVETV